MIQRTAFFLLIAGAAALFSSCASQEKPVAQTPAFGEPTSTIPWNQPQKWEGGGAGFNAMRGGEEN